MEELGVWEELVWRWSLRWRRDRFEWESTMEAELVMYISRAYLNREENDLQVWGNKILGLFSVNLAYECLAKHVRGPHHDLFKCLWKVKPFPNVMITAWRAVLGRMPTKICLSKRGVAMNTTLCALCQTKEESCQHLRVQICSVCMVVMDWYLICPTQCYKDPL